MLSSIKKLLAGEAAEKPKKAAAPEYIFLLDLERKKAYLLDLRAILRTPGARRALPRLHRLETTVTRNDARIRIPHEAMPDLVRELVSVERRVPADSPLRELMDAVPGLAVSMRGDPTPTSVLMGGHESLPGELNTREMNIAARRVGELLAHGPAATSAPPSTQTKGPPTQAKAPPTQTKAPAKSPAGKALASQTTEIRPTAKTSPAKTSPAKSAPAKAPSAKPADKTPPAKPAPPKGGPAATTPGVMVMDTTNPTEPVFGSTVMSAIEQQRYLKETGAQLEAAVLRTSELASGDMAAYFDLCLMSGEYEKIIDSLLPRVAEEPTAWAWIRLLNAAEAAKKLEFEVWCSNFKSWVAREHPKLLPDMLATTPEDLKFGVRRAGLLALEQSELSRKPTIG